MCRNEIRLTAEAKPRCAITPLRSRGRTGCFFLLTDAKFPGGSEEREVEEAEGRGGDTVREPVGLNYSVVSVAKADLKL